MIIHKPLVLGIYVATVCCFIACIAYALTDSAPLFEPGRITLAGFICGVVFSLVVVNLTQDT